MLNNLLVPSTLILTVRTKQTHADQWKKKPSTSSYVQRVIKIGGLYLVEWTVFEKKNQQQQPSVFSLPLLRHYLFSIFFFKFRITLKSITLIHCFLPYPIYFCIGKTNRQTKQYKQKQVYKNLFFFFWLRLS